MLLNLKIAYSTHLNSTILKNLLDNAKLIRVTLILKVTGINHISLKNQVKILFFDTKAILYILIKDIAAEKIIQVIVIFNHMGRNTNPWLNSKLSFKYIPP